MWGLSLNSKSLTSLVTISLVNDGYYFYVKRLVLREPKVFLMRTFKRSLLIRVVKKESWIRSWFLIKGGIMVFFYFFFWSLSRNSTKLNLRNVLEEGTGGKTRGRTGSGLDPRVNHFLTQTAPSRLVCRGLSHCLESRIEWGTGTSRTRSLPYNLSPKVRTVSPWPVPHIRVSLSTGFPSVRPPVPFSVLGSDGYSSLVRRRGSDHFGTEGKGLGW